MYKFKIENMNCMSCVHNIEDALKELDKSISIKADVKNKILLVESAQSADQLTKVIQAAGYSVNGVNA